MVINSAKEELATGLSVRQSVNTCKFMTAGTKKTILITKYNKNAKKAQEIKKVCIVIKLQTWKR